MGNTVVSRIPSRFFDFLQFRRSREHYIDLPVRTLEQQERGMDFSDLLDVVTEVQSLLIDLRSAGRALKQPTQLDYDLTGLEISVTQVQRDPEFRYIWSIA